MDKLAQLTLSERKARRLTIMATLMWLSTGVLWGLPLPGIALWYSSCFTWSVSAAVMLILNEVVLVESVAETYPAQVTRVRRGLRAVLYAMTVVEVVGDGHYGVVASLATAAMVAALMSISFTSFQRPVTRFLLLLSAVPILVEALRPIYGKGPDQAAEKEEPPSC